MAKNREFEVGDAYDESLSIGGISLLFTRGNPRQQSHS